MAGKSQVTTLDAVDEAEVAVATPAKVLKGANHDAALSGNKMNIVIHPSEGDGGSDAVFVSINGYAYQIPRNETYEVPAEVVEVLRNAKQTKLSFGEGGKIVEQTLPRYAFSVL